MKHIFATFYLLTASTVWLVAGFFNGASLPAVHPHLLAIEDTETGTYTIPWTEVPDPLPDPIVELDTEIGPCICDLTFTTCDQNCNCDTTCSDADKLLFGTLLNEGPNAPVTRTCVDADSLSINKQGRLEVTIVDNMLCVSSSNNPSTNIFFVPVTIASITDDMLATQLAAVPYTFQKSAHSSSSSATYKINDRIVAAYANGAVLSFVNTRFLPIPDIGFSSACNDGNFARFYSPTSTRCIRASSNFETDCNTGKFSVAHYLTNLRIATVPNAEAVDTGSFISVTDAGAALAASFDVGTCRCDTAVVKAEYTITVTETGTVNSATVLLTQAAVTGTLVGGVCVASNAQQFSLDFVRQTPIVSSIVARPKSGNPGYMYGLPVLGGTSTTNAGQTAISQFIAGLTLAGVDANGACSALENRRVPVQFGVDMSITCFSSKTYADMVIDCQASTGFESVLALTATYLGIWGNSDYLNIEDWIEITIAATTSSQYNSVTSTCDFVATGLNLQIFTYQVGSIYNPQNKIVAAKVTWSTDRFPQLDPDSSVAQNFALHSTVTWVRIPPNKLSVFVPPAPLLSLPNDVFHPLYLGAAGSTTFSVVITCSLILFTVVLSCIVL